MIICKEQPADWNGELNKVWFLKTPKIAKVMLRHSSN